MDEVDGLAKGLNPPQHRLSDDAPRGTDALGQRSDQPDLVQDPRASPGKPITSPSMVARPL
jgi:hypothetical protein